MPQTSKFIENILRKGRVPPKLRKHVYRTEVIKRLSKEIVKISNESICHWLVVHGMPGCGKTCLVSDTLRFSPEILGHYYEKIVWLTDRTTDISKLPNVFINAIVMLRSGQQLQKTYPENNPEFLLNEFIYELECNSRTLFVIDDVYLSDCVRFFEGLSCSIIWITSNKEIFNWLQEEETSRFFNLGDDEYFSMTEINKLSKLHGLNLNKSQLFELAKNSGGNPAFLGKIFRLALGQMEM
uniref:NB-ARC domain-containing protein n=1 Tax=Acrobeloides nanus TaxID=290746 RepID=A0A914CGX1_9BILA